MRAVFQLVLERRLSWLCRKNDLRTGNPPQSIFLIGQLRKVETPTLPVLAHRMTQPLGLARVRIIFIASIPRNVRSSAVE